MSTLKKPEWIKVKLASGDTYFHLKRLMRKQSLHTVCEEALCPNITECWNHGTATFMILGDTCTRACKFCAVKTGNPKGFIDPLEPYHLAQTVKNMKLSYVVITSVDRDDLPDGGAQHFADCITMTRKYNPTTLIEVLTPDFQGNTKALDMIIAAHPDVFAHNIETIKRLTPKVRDPKASYEQSLFVLEYVKKKDPTIYTKSSIMVGVGEEKAEVIEAMKDLRAIDVDFLAIGQYLRPTMKHLPVKRYVTPKEFKDYEEIGLKLGFKFVASGPLVRTSYRAGEFFVKNLIQKEKRM